MKRNHPYSFEFGVRLRIVREVMGITQEQLAKKVKTLSRTSIVNIEAGKQGVSIDNLLDLSRALNVRASRLLPPESGRTR
jgi:transcriptional regulator with XRE-family HTH domain